MSDGFGLAPALAERKAKNRYRERRAVHSPQGPRIEIDGKQVLNFCSNDYLGLANHASLKQAVHAAVDCYGVGSGASHLVCGHSHEHHQLEQDLAEFTGRERALLFSTGYMANLGVLQALLERGDAVFEDKLNHASLIDGALLSRAKLVRYRHCDLLGLERQLAASEARRKLIVTDGVFSMDGDSAPLAELSALAQKYKALFMVDDAHGIGCLGSSGAGLAQAFKLDQTQLPILVGTLGKAFGSFGAFVAGGAELIETLIQAARSYIYTTAMPPAVAAATREALRLVREEHWRRERLQSLVFLFRSLCAREGLPLTESLSAIQPVIVGDDERALELSEFLFSEGFLVSAIRPPTVPEGTARLRITFSAAHSEEQVKALVAALVLGKQNLDAFVDGT